ncbi:MAG: thiamine phosphate synthase, partial [Eubacteriaceae bacterium]|nr:thiamine phosphate synthase [Eubacteriaceae bacterium]
LNGRTLADVVEQSIKGGVSFLQLREKELGYDEFLKEAFEIKALTDKYKIPFVINDNIDVALACNADGVHVGQSDMQAGRVRRLIGDDKILGVSVQTVEEAKIAIDNGADYLGVGAMFPTSTKLDAGVMSMEALKKVCDSVKVPVVAIGGINETNMLRLKGTGIAGVSIISAIYAKPDIFAASKQLLELAGQIV